MRLCLRCDEELEDDFDLCWACGTARDGTEDPDFQTADETPTIYDAAEDGSVISTDELNDEFGEPMPDLVSCFMGENVTEARFVADRLREVGIPTVSDKSDLSTAVLGGFMPSAWGEGPRVRVRPQDLDRARVWIEGYRLKRLKRKSIEE